MESACFFGKMNEEVCTTTTKSVSIENAIERCHKNAWFYFVVPSFISQTALISKSESDLWLERYDCAIDILNNIHLATIQMVQMVVIISRCSQRIRQREIEGKKEIKREKNTKTAVLLKWFESPAADWNVITAQHSDSFRLHCDAITNLLENCFTTWFQWQSQVKCQSHLILF